MPLGPLSRPVPSELESGHSHAFIPTQVLSVAALGLQMGTPKSDPDGMHVDEFQEVVTSLFPKGPSHGRVNGQGDPSRGRGTRAGESRAEWGLGSRDGVEVAASERTGVTPRRPGCGTLRPHGAGPLQLAVQGTRWSEVGRLGQVTPEARTRGWGGVRGHSAGTARAQVGRRPAAPSPPLKGTLTKTFMPRPL